MKGTFLRLGVFFIVFFFLFENTFAASFADVAEGSQYYAAVEYLSDKGIVNGYSDSTFAPDKAINRAELLKMVMKQVFKIYPNALQAVSDPSQTPFNDIDANTWYLPYVTSALTKNIINGYDDGSFRPANTVNLAETLKIILLALSTVDPNMNVQTKPYADVELSTWFAAYVDFAKSLHLIELSSDGLLHPEQFMTRGRVAEILYRLLYIQENGLKTFDFTLNWPVFTKKSHNFSLKYPYRWDLIDEKNRTILWKRGEKQISFERLAPFSGSVSIYFDPNVERLTSDQYFELVKSYTPENAEIKTFVWNGLFPSMRVIVSDSESEFNDWYVYFPNNSVLIFYGSLSLGTAFEYLEEELLALEHSLSYVINDEDEQMKISETLEKARNNIFVDGAGTETLALFDDAKLIETDAIGIGTGPVDYYYSAWAQVTLKYERSFDVILAITEGRSTSF